MTKFHIADLQTRRKLRNFILTLLSLIFFSSFLLAQETGKPFIRNYKPREYKASSANYSIVQDKRGVLYFGNYKGILEFDGINWELIPTSNRTQVRSLAIDSSGQVYVGALGEFGMLLPDKKGKLQYKSLRPWLSTKDANLLEPVEVLGTESGAWFKGLGSNRMYFWNGDSLIRITDVEIEGSGQLFYLNHQLFYAHTSHGLMKWNGRNFELIPGGQKLKDHLIMSLISMGEQTLLALSYNKGIFRLRISNDDLQLSLLPTEIDQELINNVFPRGMISCANGEIVIGTTRSGIFILDRDGRKIMHLNESNGLQDNLTLGLLKDKKHSLWLGLSKGISRVEIESPWRLWDESLGLKGIVFSTTRQNDVLYAATPLGVFYLDDNYFFPVVGINNEVWQLLKIPAVENGSDGQLLAASNNGLFEIKGKRAVEVFPNRKHIFMKLYRPPGMSDRLYSIAGPKGLEIIERKGGKWQQPVSVEGLKTSFGSIALDHEGDLWFLELLGEGTVSKVETNEFGMPNSSKRKRYGKLNGLPPVNGMFHIQKKVAFATEKGVFWYDKAQDRFIADTLLGVTDLKSNKGVAYMLEGEDGNIWIERYQGGTHWLEVVYSLKEGLYRRDSVLLSGLAKTEFWGEVFPEPRGGVWAGTPEGLVRFLSEGPLDNINPVFPPLIREVKNEEDSVIFGGKRMSAYELPVLDPSRNSLSFFIFSSLFPRGR